MSSDNRIWVDAKDVRTKGMTELEIHIEKKIPFVMETKEGEFITIFPAEKRISKTHIGYLFKDDNQFLEEIKSIDFVNFISLRPPKNEKNGI